MQVTCQGGSELVKEGITLWLCTLPMYILLLCMSHRLIWDKQCGDATRYLEVGVHT